MQDDVSKKLHLYTLDLSTNKFLQALRNLCENMQALASLATRQAQEVPIYSPGMLNMQ